MPTPDLPTEILLKIFKQVIENGPFEPGGTTMAMVISQSTKIASLTLSHLRHVDNAPGVLLHFLNILRMPALEHLTIHHLHGHLHDEFVRWVADANDPWPSLRSVNFESLVLDAQALRAFESVERLRIVDGDVQHILQILEADSGLCPKINEIDAGDEIGMLQIPGRNSVAEAGKYHEHDESIRHFLKLKI
ncbi:hypothetical protein FB45DRAFT_1054093 [Roridomyces roridus]|uniref:Uncharacterized protein n=1 Tax=Roridomyces roridus TaxID=1738132 RepID=A0AAD7C7Y7_9AGAR|nr:hypothetical protein FB45DRAFT_1054093 [Roridomyces roridus]